MQIQGMDQEMKIIKTPFGNIYYFHVSKWANLPDKEMETFTNWYSRVDFAKCPFKVNIIKFSPRNRTISFIECPHFDVDHHPIVGMCTTVSFWTKPHEHETYTRRNYKNHIYHQRYLFVAEKYSGFNAQADRLYSIWLERAMKELGISKRRIGNLKYWNSVKDKIIHRALTISKRKTNQ
jgi:hypothetical protein